MEGKTRGSQGDYVRVFPCFRTVPYQWSLSQFCGHRTDRASVDRRLRTLLEWKVSLPDLPFLFFLFVSCCEPPLSQIGSLLSPDVAMSPLGYWKERDAIVMELMDGTMEDLLFTEEGEQEPDEVLHSALSVAKCLQHLHAVGVVHCDVKASNFLVGAVDGTLVSLLVRSVGHSPMHVCWQEEGGLSRYPTLEVLSALTWRGMSAWGCTPLVSVL